MFDKNSDFYATITLPWNNGNLKMQRMQSRKDVDVLVPFDVKVDSEVLHKLFKIFAAHPFSLQVTEDSLIA